MRKNFLLIIMLSICGGISLMHVYYKIIQFSSAFGVYMCNRVAITKQLHACINTHIQPLKPNETSSRRGQLLPETPGVEFCWEQWISSSSWRTEAHIYIKKKREREREKEREEMDRLYTHTLSLSLLPLPPSLTH
jgi:hypothetical protein